MKNTALWVIIGIIVLFIIVGISSYNGLINLEEKVNEEWSMVESQYQRRFDLIPNLVNTVRGYAAHERETLTAVTEARAKVGGIVNIDPSTATPEQLQQFQQAQAGLSSALQRLMVVVERYPDLKANQNFLNLQHELAGTENRISVARDRFNRAVRAYNARIRRFPVNMMANMFGFERRAYFEAAETAQEAPRVDF